MSEPSSWIASAYALEVHEVAPEGPRRIIFDLENISEHEKAAGAKSEGLTIGPCLQLSSVEVASLAWHSLRS